MSLLVRAEADIRAPKPPSAPRPKLAAKLVERIESLPEQLRKDVRGAIEEAAREIAQHGGENAEQLGRALEGAAAKISTAIESRVSESMGEVVQALTVLRTEIATLRKAQSTPASPASWKAAVERKDGKIVGVTFTQEKS